MTAKTKWIGEPPSVIPKRWYSKVKKVIHKDFKPHMRMLNGRWSVAVKSIPDKGTPEHKAYSLACKHAYKLNIELQKVIK